MCSARISVLFQLVRRTEATEIPQSLPGSWRRRGGIVGARDGIGEPTIRSEATAANELLVSFSSHSWLVNGFDHYDGKNAVTQGWSTGRAWQLGIVQPQDRFSFPRAREIPTSSSM